MQACRQTQSAYRNTSHTNEVDSNQEDSQASNPGREELPQHFGGQEGDEGGGKGAHHVGPQELAVGVIPAVTLGLTSTTHLRQFSAWLLRGRGSVQWCGTAVLCL